MKRAVSYVLNVDDTYLAASVAAATHFGPATCFVSNRAWNGSDGPWERVVKVAEAAGAEVITGDWPEEALHRKAALAEMKRRGIDYLLIPDGDEVPQAKLIENLIRIAEADLADVVNVAMDTFWQDVCHVIRPREALTPALMVKPRTCEQVHIRDYSGPRRLVLEAAYGLLLHISYGLPDERIRRKLQTWGHRTEVLDDWYRRVWLGWRENKLMRNLHPTAPQAYGFVEHISCPPELDEIAPPPEPAVEPEGRWPTVSVVIPVHGGVEDLRICLDSLAKCRDLLHEVVVVDNDSPDDSAALAAGYEFVTLIRCNANEGFGKASNLGIRHSTGEVVVCLNSDTAVPRAGLIRLVQSLMSSGSVGAAGPFTNQAGYHQPTAPTYTELANLDLFAEDFARRSASDVPVEMLVGFCLAVRRSALDEVGLFDEQFGIGLYEDTELMYRLQRAGYKLLLSARAYVHHKGSATLNAVVSEPNRLLDANQAKYIAKWKLDLETGFASHLAGFDPAPIVFAPERKPEVIIERLKGKARRARISLCIIARDEERCIRACLESAMLVAFETIVVDTGSTDRTADIAREMGARVVSFPWTDSFADARNESMRHATGDYIFWVDCDDTLSLASAELILDAALAAEAEAFVIPVQFVENGQARGTSVDHVKLFRNFPGLKWSRRIHEQILHEFSARGITPARLKDAAVLHTHYDSTPEGQARKLARDRRLLNLQFAEDPKDPFTIFCMGMTEHHAKVYAAAIDWLTKALEVSTPQMTHARKIYAILAMSLRESGRPDAALEALGQGLEHFPDDPELHFHAALIHQDAGRLQEAVDHLRSYGEDVSDHFSSLDTGILTYKRWALLGDLYTALGNYDEARKWYGECMRRESWFANAPIGLFDAALKFGDLARAAELLETLVHSFGPCTDWAVRLCRYAERVGGTQNVLPYLESQLSRFALAEEPRLTYARVLLDFGRKAEAATQFEILERSFPPLSAVDAPRVADAVTAPRPKPKRKLGELPFPVQKPKSRHRKTLKDLAVPPPERPNEQPPATG